MALSKLRLFFDIYTSAPRLEVHLRGSFAKHFFVAFTSRHPKFPVLARKKWGVAVLPLASFGSFDEYLKSVSGKNSAAYFSRRAHKAGYQFRCFDPDEFFDAIDEIHKSSVIRQGQRMSSEYDQIITKYPKDDCLYFGVFSKEGKLVAYTWIVDVGGFAILNRTMGHAQFLKDNVMYFLFTNTIQKLMSEKFNYFMYDMYIGGGAGLKLFKSRIGFKPYVVEWKMKVEENEN